MYSGCYSYWRQKKSGLTQKEIRSFLSNHSTIKDVTQLK